MINRQYFMHARVTMDDGTIRRAYRVINVRSLFKDALFALNYGEDLIAEKFGVSKDQVLTVSFNRC